MNDYVDIVDDIRGCGRFLIDNAKDIVGDSQDLDEVCITIVLSRTSCARLDVNKTYFPGNLGI